MVLTPEEVQAYTEIEHVKQRDLDKLEVDIACAYLEIEEATGIDYSLQSYLVLPLKVKTALLLLSEYYAATHGLPAVEPELKSETIGDYKYERTTVSHNYEKPDLVRLLAGIGTLASKGRLRTL